jgi:hypothetical protein
LMTFLFTAGLPRSMWRTCDSSLICCVVTTGKSRGPSAPLCSVNCVTWATSFLNKESPQILQKL